MVLATLAVTLAVSAADLPLSDEHAVLVAEAQRLRQTLGDHVWPGFSGIDCPVALQVGDRDYLIGFPAPVEGFATVAAPARLGEASVQVGPRSNAADLAASYWMHGSPAVVIATPEALEISPTVWTLKAVHEMFHVMQSRRGEFEKVGDLQIGPQDDASWQLDFPFPYEDETACGMIHLQAWPCFRGAMELDDAEARYAAGVALEAAGAMDRYLELSGAPARSAAYAAFQAWKEGVAMWVEQQMARAAAEQQYEPSAPFAALDGYVSFEQVWRDGYSGRGFLAKHAGRAARSRSMFYHLGMAKAMLLERLDPTWKQRYFDRGVWLDDLLRSAAAAPAPGGSPANPQARASEPTAPAPPTSSDPQPDAFPFHYADGLVFIDVLVNGAEQALFLLDTGANAPALDDDLAARLHLQSIGPTTVLGTAGQREVETVRIDKLSLCGRDLHDLRATVYDLSGSLAPEGRELGGIIGYDLLNRFAVEIDFARRRLRLCEAPGACDTAIPLRLESGIPRISAVLDSWYSVELRLDTGASLRQTAGLVINVLDRDYRALLGRDPAIEPAGTATGVGVGGEVELRLYRIDSFTLGERAFDAPTIIVQPAVGYFALPHAVGFVSNNLLEKYGRVTLDYAGARICVHRP